MIYPSKKIVIDFCMLNGKIHIAVVGYNSRYIEVLQLQSQTAGAVIIALKVILAKHCINMT